MQLSHQGGGGGTLEGSGINDILTTSGLVNLWENGYPRKGSTGITAEGDECGGQLGLSGNENVTISSEWGKDIHDTCSFYPDVLPTSLSLLIPSDRYLWVHPAIGSLLAFPFQPADDGTLVVDQGSQCLVFAFQLAVVDGYT